jgi:hypothetical protein
MLGSHNNFFREVSLMTQSIEVLDSGIDFDNFAAPIVCCSMVAISTR